MYVFRPIPLKKPELTEQAAKELDIEYQVLKIYDITKIMEYEVMMTPALVVDGEVKVSGRVPKIDENQEINRITL